MDIKLLVIIIVFFCQILIFYRKDKSLKGIVLFLIFSSYAIKPYIEDFANILDASITLFVILGIFLILFSFLYKNNRITLHLIRTPIFMIIFCVMVILNGFYNAFYKGYIDSLYIQGLINVSYITLLVSFVFIVLRSEKTLLNILSSTKLSLYMLIFFGLYDFLINKWERVGSDVNPNYYAQMLIILLVFHVYSNNKNLSENISLYFLSVILVFLSDSSSGKISIILLSLITIFVILKIKKWTINILGFVYVFIIFYFIYKTIKVSITGGIMDIFLKDDLSRVYIWQYAWESIKENIWIGHEYNTFRSPWNNMYFVTHNDYLRIAAELGGISAIIFIFYIFLQINKMSLIKNNMMFYLSSSLFFVTITYSITHNNINNFMFWIGIIFPSIAYIIQYEKRYTDEDKSPY
ncbi:O-antigen ligase family protein [Exiguobacterium sp. PHA03]|uniref:O-antigen ligase family protein n=1 Tax=Exiguobacterium sp. PHA03 TaxID=3064895 RepID=UPI0035BEC163